MRPHHLPLLPLLAACTSPKTVEIADTADSADTGHPDTGDSDTGAAVGVMVLCGGGSEGDLDDLSAWSAVAYGALLEGGDVTGDGLVRVAVLSAAEETEWIPTYFVAPGADESFNVTVSSLGSADDPAVAADFQDVDVAFLKGGDQGEYYDLWNGTALEEALRALVARGGGVGGTSAGAMSLSQYALAGGEDYVSADVLEDATTSYLDDASDGGTGIHTNFLGFLPDAYVDTHVAARGRLGRIAGVLAKAIDEGAPADLLGIGLDEQTCLTVRGTQAAVNGVGTVVFLRPGDEPALREPGAPLVWAGLRLDRLTEGWVYDLDAGAVDTDSAPADAEDLGWDGTSQAPVAGDWSVDGATTADEERFAWVVDRYPEAFALHAGTGSPPLQDAIGILDAHDSDRRGANEEAMFRALYDHLEASGFLVGDGGAMDRVTDTLVGLRGTGRYPLSTLVLDPSGVTWRSLSPSVSGQDAGDGALHAAGLVGMKLNILYTDGADGRAWDLVARKAAE